MTRLVRAACVLLVAAGAVVAVYAFGDTPLMVDELVHYPQIVGFARKYSRIDPRLTMIPAYHAIVAGLSWVFGGLSTRFFWHAARSPRFISRHAPTQKNGPSFARSSSRFYRSGFRSSF